MRILHVIDSMNRGGAEVMLTAMAPQFRTRGVTCDVLALLKRPSPLEHSLLDQGVYLRYTGVRGLYSPRQILVLARLLRGYDLVHVHLFPAQLWTVLAAALLRCRIPLVTTEHNTWNARRRWWWQPLDLWMYSRYRRIACNSEATAEHLARWCPGVAKKNHGYSQRDSAQRIRKCPASHTRASPARSVAIDFCGAVRGPERPRDAPASSNSCAGCSPHLGRRWPVAS